MTYWPYISQRFILEHLNTWFKTFGQKTPRTSRLNWFGGLTWFQLVLQSAQAGVFLVLLAVQLGSQLDQMTSTQTTETHQSNQRGLRLDSSVLSQGFSSMFVSLSCYVEPYIIQTLCIHV